MNFRQLEVFISVVRHSSFSKAAQQLYLTQPTVSTHISSLEDELGVQLVTRGKTVSATGAGAVFYEYANTLLKMRENAAEVMKGYPNLLTSTIELASSTVPAEYILPSLLSEFREKYPNVNFIIRESNSDAVLQKLLANEVELGFTGADLRNDKCTFKKIKEDELVIITPREEKYEKLRGNMDIESIKTSPFVLRTSGSATQKEADSFLINMGIPIESLKVAAYVESIEAIKQCVKNRMGIAIVSELAIKDMEENGDILVFRVDNSFMKRNLYLVYRNDVSLSPSAELLINFITGK